MKLRESCKWREKRTVQRSIQKRYDRETNCDYLRPYREAAAASGMWRPHQLLWPRGLSARTCTMLSLTKSSWFLCTLHPGWPPAVYTPHSNSSPKFFFLFPETKSISRNLNSARLRPDFPVSGRFLPNLYQIQLISRLVLKRNVCAKFKISSCCAATHWCFRTIKIASCQDY